MNSGVKKVFIAMVLFALAGFILVFTQAAQAYYPYGQVGVSPVYNGYAVNRYNGYNNQFSHRGRCNCNNYCNNRYSNNAYNNVNFAYTNGYAPGHPRFHGIPANTGQTYYYNANPYFNRAVRNPFLGR